MFDGLAANLLAWWTGAFAGGCLVVFFAVATRLPDPKPRDLVGSAAVALGYATLLGFASNTWPTESDTFGFPITLALYIAWVAWVAFRISEKTAMVLAAAMAVLFLGPLVLLLLV